MVCGGRNLPQRLAGETDPVAVDLWGVFIPARKVGGTRWELPVEVTVRNTEYEDRPVRVLCELLSPEGKWSVKFRFPEWP